jgi:hypothetical protein
MESTRKYSPKTANATLSALQAGSIEHNSGLYSLRTAEVQLYSGIEI